MPEYVRIRRALRETTTAHSDAVKLLERSVQAVYSMKNLAALLTTDEGENQVLKRLQVIDQARSFLNSIAIDSEGENYDFKTTQFAGVSDVIDSTCNMLSALTNIPQTILFGRSPAGMNATGDSDLENYYNFVERIQKLMLKRNLRDLLDVIFRAGVASKEVDEIPDYKLTFNPLWSLSDTEQATVDQTRAATAQVKAQTAQIYVDMQALDPSEVRRSLASDEDFNVEDIITEDDDDPFAALLGAESTGAVNELEAQVKNIEEQQTPGGTEQTGSGAPGQPFGLDGDTDTGVGVLVVKDVFAESENFTAFGAFDFVDILVVVKVIIIVVNIASLARVAVPAGVAVSAGRIFVIKNCFNVGKILVDGINSVGEFVNCAFENGKFVVRVGNS